MVFLTSEGCHGGIRYYVGLVFYVYHRFFCSLCNVLYDNDINKPKKKEAEGGLQTQLTMRFYAKLEIY